MIFDFLVFSRLTSSSSALLARESERPAVTVAGYIIGTTNPLPPDLFCRRPLLTTKNRFCIALETDLFDNPTDNTLQDLIEVLGPAFFNPHYFTLDGHPLVFVINTPEKDIRAAEVGREKTEEGLKSLFVRLGYDRYYYCCIAGEEDLRIAYTNIPYNTGCYSKPLSGDTADFANWYTGILEHGGGSQKLFVVLKEAELSPAEVISVIDGAEKGLKTKNPYFFSLLEENARLLRQVEQANIRICELDLDLESKSAYIKNNDAQDHTVKRIADFYNTEYEILPMWYKRFGHVIKVLMGKRTFRSLYDDKVKKYKD